MLLEIMREIGKIEKDDENYVADIVDEEEDRWRHQQRTLDDRKMEMDIVRAQISGDQALVATAERRKAVEAETRSLVAEGFDRAEAHRMAEEDAELRAKAARETALKDLQDEHEIMTAKIAGNRELVEKLEKQRDIHREIDRLERDGLDAETAKNQATRAADDKQDLQTKERRRKVDEINADDEVTNQQAHHHRTGARHAADRAFELKRRNELKDQGISDADINSILDREMDTRRRQQGVIGGPSAKGDDSDPFGKGLTNEQDWRNRFPKPLGDQVPEPSNRPPEVPEGKPVTGDDTKGADATTSVAKAGQSGQTAGQALAGAADSLAASLDKIQQTVETKFTALVASVDSLDETLGEKISELTAKVDTAVNNVANIA